MRDLIRNADLRRLFTGLPMCVVAGLAAGALMQPRLKSADEIQGPQMLAGVSGARAEGAPDATASWASYQGQIPDYVIGTDWRQPRVWGDAPAESTEPAQEPGPDLGHAADAVEATWEEPPRRAPRYPSESGGVAYGAEWTVEDPDGG